MMLFVELIREHAYMGTVCGVKCNTLAIRPSTTLLYVRQDDSEQR